MGAYTQSIREILQMNQTPQQKLTNPQDVHDIAEAVIFDDIPTGVISNDYIDQFITGFTLHFMNDELGLETLPLWKIALNEKLFNYGSYINKIYANLDKEVFENYRVTNVQGSGTTSANKSGSASSERTLTDDTTTTVADDNTQTNDLATGLRRTVTGTGTVQDAKTGSDSTTHTGTDNLENGGYDTASQTGTDANAHTGTVGTAGTNSNDTTNTGTTGTDDNRIGINYQTPMGSLQNLRTPGGDARGTGVSYANSQTYNYMTAADELNASSVVTDNTRQQSQGTDSSTTTYNDTNTETKNLTDRTDYASTKERTLNLEDETTYGSSSTQTRNTTDTTVDAGTNTGTVVNDRDITTTVDGSKTDNVQSSHTDTEAGTHSDTSNTIDYTMNWEMLYRSMPLLNKVWEVFDDLFMQIF